MCDCIEIINRQLEERGHNTELDITFSITDENEPARVVIATSVKTPKRGARPTSIRANYCPFCGEKYPTPCAKCGQIDRGQTGEHPCPECGLPTIHDDAPVDAAAEAEPGATE